MTEEKCANCRYGYHFFDSTWNYYECRRRAPVKVKNENGYHAWPTVSAKDWCGDYTRYDGPELRAN